MFISGPVFSALGHLQMLTKLNLYWRSSVADMEQLGDGERITHGLYFSLSEKTRNGKKLT